MTNYCNNNCGYCTYKRWDFDNDARSMAFDNFTKYAKRLRELGIQGIILTGGGEPTISPDFQRITAWMDYNKFKYGVNTNFNKYVECNPEYLKVSLDAWDEDSYEEKRGVRKYKEVRENIRTFASYKKTSTKLGIQLLAKSVSDINNFYEANKDLPVDYIVIRPVESTNSEYYIQNPNVHGILDAIDTLRRLDSRVVKNFKWDMLNIHFASCVGQWSQIALNELGEVMYCCHKPYQIVGHIMDDDILEKKRNAKTDMKMCDVPCRLTSTNSILTQITAEQPNREFI